MQWFDAIMTFATFGGSAFGLIHLWHKKENHRHEERMAESERKHDRFVQQIAATMQAPNQSTLQRIRAAAQDWHDKEW